MPIPEDQKSVADLVQEKMTEDRAPTHTNAAGVEFVTVSCAACGFRHSHRSELEQPTPPLDVERLAEAIRNIYIAPSASREMDAENIAAEYERLARDD